MEDETTFYAFYCIGERAMMEGRIYTTLKGFIRSVSGGYALHSDAEKLSSLLLFNIYILEGHNISTSCFDSLFSIVVLRGGTFILTIWYTFWQMTPLLLTTGHHGFPAEAGHTCGSRRNSSLSRKSPRWRTISQGVCGELWMMLKLERTKSEGAGSSFSSGLCLLALAV